MERDQLVGSLTRQLRQLGCLPLILKKSEGMIAVGNLI